MDSIVRKVDEIFEHSNAHMRDKLKHFGCQSANVIKYVCAKLRKYRGEFFESNKTIAKACGVSVRTVQNAIKRAEQLEIFVVSERTESTFNEKMRRTSNLIQLLPYKTAEIVRKVVSVARKVSSMMRAAGAKKQPKAQRYVREEIVPEWIGKKQSKPEVDTDDRARFGALQARLRTKYARNNKAPD